MARGGKVYPELRPSGARRTADQLREHILTLPEGAYLGSEEDLANLLGVGRHTLRQTARLLEDQRLLKVKRGVGGGYYSMRPDIDAVADAAATYLRARAASIRDLFEAARVLDVELSRLAALSQNEAAREWLGRIAAHVASAPPASREAVEELDFELRDCLFALAGNPFIELMMRVHVRFTFQDRRLSLLHEPERVVEYGRNRAALMQAILAQDAEMAELLARRFGRLIQRWISDELAKREIGPTGGG